jgi:hypothetical protein
MAKPQIDHTDTVVNNAYHGTDRFAAEKILADGRFNVSRGPDHWLGDGVYFFQGSIAEAKWWARKTTKERRLKEYAILKAKVLLGKCLDLTKTEFWEQLEEWIEYLKEKGVRDLTDAYVINSFAGEWQGGFDTVRCRFQGKRPFRGSKMYREQIQISVRTTKNISGIELCV